MNLVEMYRGERNFVYLKNVSNEKVFIYGYHISPGGCIVVPIDLATTVTGMVDAFEIQGLTHADERIGPVFGWDARYEPTENFEQPGDRTYQEIRRNQSHSSRAEERRRMLDQVRAREVRLP